MKNNYGTKQLKRVLKDVENMSTKEYDKLYGETKMKEKIIKLIKKETKGLFMVNNEGFKMFVDELIQKIIDMEE